MHLRVFIRLYLVVTIWTLGVRGQAKNCDAGTTLEKVSKERYLCAWCPPGTYQPFDDTLRECIEPDEGYYAYDHIARKNGYNVGMKTQEKCSTGRWTDDGITCHWCDKGESTEHASGIKWPALAASDCRTCSRGTYGFTRRLYADDGSWRSYERICGDCPAGTWQDQYGQIGESSCNSCPAGHTSPPGTSYKVERITAEGVLLQHCSPCKAGTYESLGVCNECKPGTQQADTGKTVCPPCLEGTYQNETGQASCTGCPEGTSQNQRGQPSSDSCGACAVGTFQDKEGQTSCRDCSVGTYQNQRGQPSCTRCPVGTHQNNEGQASCSPDGGLNQDWECRFGWIRELDRCVPCLSGSEGAQLTIDNDSRNVCQQCAVGTFKTKEMAPDDMCEACPTGKYSATIGAAECTDCPAGQSTGSPNSVSIDDCMCGEVPRRPVPAPPLLAESQSAVDFYATWGLLG